MKVVFVNPRLRVRNHFEKMADQIEPVFVEGMINGQSTIEISTFAAHVIVLHMEGDVAPYRRFCEDLSIIDETEVIVTDQDSNPKRCIEILDAGAVDYVSGGFDLEELQARIRVRLRSTQRKMPVLRVGPLTFFDTTHEAHIENVDLRLTRIEYRILRALAYGKGRIVSRESLIVSAMGEGAEIFDRTVDSHIKNIRKKIKAVDPSRRLVRSIYGEGYTLEI